MDKRTWRESGEQVVRDLRSGVRALRRSPAASTAAVLSVALGIGANTAIFSMLNAIVWRPPAECRELAFQQFHIAAHRRARRGDAVRLQLLNDGDQREFVLKPVRADKRAPPFDRAQSFRLALRCSH
jgi:hypothetical protein